MQVLEHGIEGKTKRQVNHHQLALRTLSTLLRQHNKNNDLRDLLSTLVLSVSGQFRTPSVFVHLVNLPITLPNQLTYFGIGRYRHYEQTISPDHLEAVLRKFKDPIASLSIHDLAGNGRDATLYRFFEQTGLHLLLAFRHEEKLVGILGLGHRPQDDLICDDDVDVLITYATSVAPFIGNLFLFLTLANVNQRHASILNATRQAVMVFDRDGCLVSLNEAAKAMVFRNHPSEDNGTSLVGVSHKAIFQSDRYPHWDHLLSSIDLDTAEAKDGIIVTKTDANGRVYKLSITLLDNSAPDDSDVVVVIDDISEQKEREAQVMALQIDAEKGYMVSEIAHEMSNFISVILGSAELAQQACQNADQEAALRKLDKLVEKAALLQRYSDGLVTKHHLTPNWSLENINSIIDCAASFCEIQKRFAGIGINLELAPDMPRIRMDPDQITQVLLNLLNNASDAIRDSKKENGSIVVSSSVLGDSVLVKITDNGAGIPKEIAERLFTESLTTKKDGHGHGTIVCGKIIQNHSGTIEVDSKPGSGASFLIRLPLGKR